MYYIGVDVGGMSIKAGIINENGEILLKKSFVTDNLAPSQVIIGAIADFIESLAAEYGLSLKEISGIGLGFPGSVDSKGGIVRYCCNINLVKVRAVSLLKQRLGVPNIKITNDANAAALGETLFGAGRGYQNAALVTLGTGVGFGMVIDGKLFEGGYSAGTEGGHMQIVKGGDTCGCGEKGHWEAFASATALIRMAKRAAEKHPESLLARLADEEGLSGKTAFKAAKQGDKTAIALIKKYLEYVGMGIVNIANLFFPEIIIMGGGISNEGDYIVKPIQRYLNKHIYGKGYNPKIKVTAASLKNDAGIVGAAALTMHNA
jgi:glucokinase